MPDTVNRLALQKTRKAIRRYLSVLPENEPVDLVVMATVLCNFNPRRRLPHWLILVARPGGGKTALISLLEDWQPHVWRLPMPITPAYFLSSYNLRRSALYRIVQSRARILYTPDMLELMSLSRDDTMKVHAQLIAIYDGSLKRSTGLNPKVMHYRPHPEHLLGWISAATPRIYPWLDKFTTVGARFHCYAFDGGSEQWDDPETLVQMELAAADAGEMNRRERAGQELRAYLDYMLPLVESSFNADVDRGHPGVTISEEQIRRLASAVALVTRCMGDTISDDSGKRLITRAVELVRMIAFMRGKAEVTEAENAIGIRLVVSQIPIETRKCLEFAVIPQNQRHYWRIASLCAWVGGSRQVYRHPLEHLADVELLRWRPAQAGSAGPVGHFFKIRTRTLNLIKAFDPDARVFDWKNDPERRDEDFDTGAIVEAPPLTIVPYAPTSREPEEVSIYRPERETDLDLEISEFERIMMGRDEE